MPRLEPPVVTLAEPFWEATKNRQLSLQHCAECDRFVWYPRDRCPSCLRDSLSWTLAAGTGTVYSFNVMRKPGNPLMADQVPYVIALVDLDEGVRMTTNIVGCEPEEVYCDQRVVVDWSVELTDGRLLPVFKPVADLARPTD
jgi:uncharacterized OB-fold protein